jgi:hypothetical protein
MPVRSWVCGFALLLLSVPAFAVKTKSLNEGLTHDQVASAFTGAGAVITNIKITGSNLSVGTFTEGEGIGLTNGVVLSTGDVADAVGPNGSQSTGDQLGTAGAPALDAIVSPFVTHDAAIIEFDVVTESPTFAIRYVFASEEYREFVDSEFNDVFAFFVNGSNIAITPGTAQPVTINTINHLRNQGLYRDNEGGVSTEFDGFTVPLQAVGIVEPGTTNHIRIAIADTSDFALDSAVFIAQGGISGSLIAPIIVPKESAFEAFFVSEGTEVDLPIFFAFEKFPPTITASGIPGATVTFSPIFRDATGQAFVRMKVVLGPDTPPGAHVLTIRTTVPGAESLATITAVVDCQPPAILGTGQPTTQVVDRGKSATLRVTPTGSAVQYQWYSGFAGMTRNPIAGATGAELHTAPVNELQQYWVRVTNPCGSFDSLAAFAIPR